MIGLDTEFIFGKIIINEHYNGAKEKKKQGKIEKPFVIGAILTLDYCLDLVDSEFINTLSVYYKAMKDDFDVNNKDLSKNSDVAKDEHKDLLIRELDCAVIEYMHQKIDEQYLADIKKQSFTNFKRFDTARGVFTEGGAAFPGAGIQKKSHIQICVRNTKSIKGFFLPRKELLT